MRREWDPEDLIDCWTLVDADRSLVGNKTGPTRLGFALSLKFFELEARFPRQVGEIPPAAVEYVASQVKVDPGKLEGYRFSGRTFEYHRAQTAARSASERPRAGTRRPSGGGWPRRCARSSSGRRSSATPCSHGAGPRS
ncbi:MAG: DUF4158 domain-containing protein [Actinomycetota bacterium]|nr:DUF4158 domain-containing protein [Actinomycetota bacterium]